MHRSTRILIIITTLMVSACQGSASSSQAETTASGTTLTTDALVAPTTGPPTSVSPSTDAQTITAPPAQATTTDDGANPFGGNDAEDGLMPSVVCMNLQDAQNEIQDHGVFASGSEDATGQGRSQIIDSNWQVVGQDPDAGTPIGEFDAMLLVVKYGEEPNPC
jgi:PASTA domain